VKADVSRRERKRPHEIDALLTVIVPDAATDALGGGGFVKLGDVARLNPLRTGIDRPAPSIRLFGVGRVASAAMTGADKSI
jgi:hypothetical protein